MQRVVVTEPASATVNVEISDAITKPSAVAANAKVNPLMSEENVLQARLIPASGATAHGSVMNVCLTHYQLLSRPLLPAQTISRFAFLADFLRLDKP